LGLVAIFYVAGSDVFNGYSGFVDGAIESGVCGASLAAALA
jgi:monoamine oxidase